MSDFKKHSKMSVPLIVGLIYTAYYYFGVKFLAEQDLLIGLQQVTWDNIGMKFMIDFSLMLLFPVILMLVYGKKLSGLIIRPDHSKLQYVLAGILVVLFLFHGNYSISGYYAFFFYLVIVSFGEELIFRGYVYSMLKSYNRWFAIIASGLLWGLPHAILPGLIAGSDLGRIGMDMLSQVGFGIVTGFYFIYLLEKSKSLSVPILVHTILNYSVGPIGTLTAVGAGFYLFQKDRLDRKNKNYEPDKLDISEISNN